MTKCLCFDWSLGVHRIDLQKHAFIENMPRCVIFNNAYQYSMISIQWFSINNGAWHRVCIYFHMLPERKLLSGCVLIGGLESLLICLSKIVKLGPF